MRLKGRIGKSRDLVREILSRRNYLLISLIVGTVSFILMYYLLVAKVADNDIWISVMMSGVNFVTFSIVSGLIISALFGIYVSLFAYRVKSGDLSGKGFFGVLGGIVGGFSVGCPTCGAVLFGLVGAPLALMYLPFRGLELQVLSIIILLISIHLVAQSVLKPCKIKNK